MHDSAWQSQTEKIKLIVSTRVVSYIIASLAVQKKNLFKHQLKLTFNSMEWMYL